jgi:hypothetical protein
MGGLPTYLRSLMAYMRSAISPYRELRNIGTALTIISEIRGSLGAPGVVGSPQFEKLDKFLSQSGIRQHILTGTIGPDPVFAAVAGQLEPNKLGPLLDDLALRLKIRRLVLGPMAAKIVSEPSEPTSRPPSTVSTGKSTQPTEGEPDGNPQKATEAAFLWTTTEKLYGSWPFRVLGMMLLAAVLLAGAGSFFIGGQTLHLKEDIEKTGQSAKNGLETIGKTTRESLSELSQNLTNDIDRRRSEVTEKMAQATKVADDFRHDADQLKQVAVEKIISELRNDLKQHESGLAMEITAPLIAIRDRDVTELNQTAGKLKERVQELVSSAASGDLQAIGTKVERLRELAVDADKISAAFLNVRADQDSAHKAQLDASEQAELARQRARAAEALVTDIDKLQKRITDMLQPAMGETVSHLRALAAMRQQLDTARQPLADFEKDVKRIDAVGPRLANLENLVNELEDRARKVILPVIPIRNIRNESDLTVSDWMQIQMELAARNFSPGSIDGAPGKRGSNTRKAIRSFQTSISQEPTGYLTLDQIHLLLKTQSAAQRQTP